MNKLLLNFLFFVASALILIQCAMLFPSTDKIVKRQHPEKAGTVNRGKLIATITNISVGEAQLKSKKSLSTH